MADHRPVGAGSPTPVIIPPTFQPAVQRDSTTRSSTTDAAASKAVLEAPASAISTAPQASTILPPTTSISGTIEQAGSTPVPMPMLTPTTSASVAVVVPPLSQPKPILQHERAEAGHVGLERSDSLSVRSDTASVTSGVSTAMFRTDESTYHRSASSPVKHVAASPARPSAATSKAPSRAASALGPSTTGPAHHAGAGAGAHGDKDKPKSQKEMTKAERRELQEQQRAAKAQGSSKAAPAAPAGPVSTLRDSGKLEPRTSVKSVQPATVRDQDRRLEQTSSMHAGSDHGGPAGPPRVKKQQGAKVVSLNPTEMFAHLQQFKKVSMETLLSYKDAGSLPPQVLQLGLRYADGSITGASARCMAMLHMFCQVIEGYTTPANARLNRDLTSQLNNMIDFLVKCRPLALSMGNAIKWLKLRIAAVPPEMPEAEAKEQLVTEIKDFIRNRIDQAHVWLAQLAAEKVDEGDVVMTYAYSHIVAHVLLEALRPSQAQGGSEGTRQPKRFRVVVVDSRPEHEGLLMLKKLQAAGIACTYAHMNALSFVMQGVTKVFLGASAVMSNGTVMCRAGNAAVAMMAHAHNKPVIVCCESYKFHERVQLDAITHNELGDPDALARVAGRPDVKALEGWQSTPRLALLNLKYDAMPAHYVTAIVTEHALIPPTSVPVVIREYMAMNRE